ncbi:unnamed protein product [Ilex paraguariensis]|uniref:Wall-associated receptor kinase galacturonan-binding domain-containing protein n=1 Tax=Ilex paraguariensis TaxID=185542 RepID=A0ABC8TEW7_9AQUA
MMCCKAQQNNDQNCTSSCGNIHDIHYPFRLEDDPQHCGLPDYQLACNNNRTILYLKADPYAGYDYKFNYSYYVEAITYDNFSIRLVDPGLDKDNCSSLPLHSLPYTDYFGFSTAGPYFGVMFTSCQNPVNRSGYVDASFCDKRNTTSTSNTTSPSPLQNHNYVVREGMDISELEDSCSIGNLVWTTANILGPATEGNIFFSDLYDGLAYGFELLWYRVYCGQCEARGGFCLLGFEDNVVHCSGDGARTNTRTRIRNILRNVLLGEHI